MTRVAHYKRQSDKRKSTTLYEIRQRLNEYYGGFNIRQTGLMVMRMQEINERLYAKAAKRKLKI